jgi:hypothetical protein
MTRRKGDEWKHRPNHPAFAKLSAGARQYAVTSFRRGEPTTRIVEAIKSQFTETIAGSSLSRYREYWDTTLRVRDEARQSAQELIADYKLHPSVELEELLVQHLTTVQFQALLEASKTAEPLDLLRVTAKAEKNAIERAKLKAAAGPVVDPAQLFLEWLQKLVGYLREHDQDALATLQPHMKAFAATVKAA